MTYYTRKIICKLESTSNREHIREWATEVNNQQIVVQKYSKSAVKHVVNDW